MLQETTLDDVLLDVIFATVKAEYVVSFVICNQTAFVVVLNTNILVCVATKYECHQRMLVELQNTGYRVQLVQILTLTFLYADATRDELQKKLYTAQLIRTIHFVSSIVIFVYQYDVLYGATHFVLSVEIETISSVMTKVFHSQYVLQFLFISQIAGIDYILRI